MTLMPFDVTLAVELVAAGLGGLQGALFAAGVKDRRIDVLGVVVVGLAVALGGSILRDLLLAQQPAVLRADGYLLVAGAAALAGMLLQPLLAGARWPITVLDAVVMGIFAAIGASKALSLGASATGALVVGVVAAIGGGVLRDLLLDRPVSILHVGTLYAVAAGAGAATLVALVRLEVPVPIAGVVAASVATGVRLAAVAFGWTFPEQRSWRSAPT